jgi:hypothetical protein
MDFPDDYLTAMKAELIEQVITDTLCLQPGQTGGDSRERR